MDSDQDTIEQDASIEDGPEEGAGSEQPSPRVAVPPMFDRQASPGLAGDDHDDDAPGDSLSRFITGTATATEEREEDEDSLLPMQPRSLLDLGLSKAFLTDLTMKIIHYSGTPSSVQLTRRIGLGRTIVQHLIAALQEEHLVEVQSQSDLYTGNYRYRLSTRGQQRVNDALERSRYAGPAPVTAEQYGEVMRKMQTQTQDPGRGRIKSLLSELVLSTETSDSVARALFSGKTGVLFGPSGNGKTSILERFSQDLDGHVVVPYSIYAYGQVIRVFDQSIHQPVPETNADETRFDRRWVMVKRPSIVVGAEIGQETLDLAYDPNSRFYQAPPHVKAQGGLLVVDDFGRQRIPARDLLTRWLIPLERGWDALTLATGEKLIIPFNLQILFGTNLRLRDLADDALLRRVLYKVEIPNPNPQEFTEILRKLCHEKHVLVQEGALDHVAERLFDQPGIKPRAANARDLLDMVIEGASFDGREPILNEETFDRVFRLFVAQETESDESSSY